MIIPIQHFTAPSDPCRPSSQPASSSGQISRGGEKDAKPPDPRNVGDRSPAVGPAGELNVTNTPSHVVKIKRVIQRQKK